MRGRHLNEGDEVRIVAPAGPFERDLFDQGVEVLRSIGLRPSWRKDIFDKDRYLAGSDGRRLDEIQEAFADPRAKAVFCARGGYGCTRLLDRIDFNSIRTNPKPLIGFSDNSALLIEAYRLIGLVSIHGPMVAGRQISSMIAEVRDYFKNLLFSSAPFGAVPDFSARPLHDGLAEGLLIPCNLTLLVHMMAAGKAPDFSGAILVAEDVAEPPYRIDRMLTALKSAGVFDKINGFILGEFHGVEEGDLKPILADFSSGWNFPCVYDAPIGHGKRNLPIPIGVKARLDATHGCLELLESVVC